MFTPRNIEQRQKTLKIIQAKEAQRLKELTSNLTKTIKGLKGTGHKGTCEQFLTNLFTDCLVKTDQKKYPGDLFLFDNRNNLLLEIDTKDQEIWASIPNVYEPLEHHCPPQKEHKIHYWHEIETWVEKHLTPLKSYEIYPYKWSQYDHITEHFKTET